MQGFWRRFGWFWMSTLPAVACMALQLWAVLQLVWTTTFIIAIRAAAVGLQFNQEELAERLNLILMDVASLGVLNYHVIGIGLFGMWYALISYKYRKQKRETTAKRKAGVAVRYVWPAVLAVFLGIMLSAFTIQLLEVGYYLVPSVIDDYAQLVDQSGVGSLFIVFAAVFLAPVGEELLCRGVIQHYASKVSRRFFIVNVIQALGFGIMHGNLVQGSYAFLIGLVLGWLRYRYDSLWIPMVIHFVVNLCSLFPLERVLGLFPEHLSIDAALLLILSGLMAGVLILVELLLKAKNNEY